MDIFKISEENQLFEIELHINKHNVNQELNGASLLYWYVYMGEFNVVEKLLEKGADPNQRDINGRLPLEIAAYFGFYKICKALLKYGAAIDDDCIRRAEHGWDGNRQTEVLKLFEEWQRK